MPRVRNKSTDFEEGRGRSAVERRPNDGAKLKVRSFDPEVEKWEYYLPYFELELEAANIVEEDGRRDALLRKVGSKSFKMLFDHYRPRPLRECSYAELLGTLKGFYEEALSVTAERVAFNLRKREKNEKIRQFVNDLRALAGRCEFGNSLTERIRDQIIVGINNSDWQYELLKAFPGNGHSLAQVEALSIQLEHGVLAKKRLDRLAGEGVLINKIDRNEQNEDVRVSRRRNEEERKKLDPKNNCLRCGWEKHKDLAVCPAQGRKCNRCGGQNHFARVCRRRSAIPAKDEAEGRRVANRLEEQTVETPGTDSDSDENSDLGCRQLARGNKVMLKIKINGKPIRMLYDSGAYQSVISRRIWESIGHPELDPYPNLRAYTNVEVKTLGIVSVAVEAFGVELRLPVIVVEKDDIPLFGLKWALQFNLPLPAGAEVCTMKGENEEQSKDVPFEIKEFFREYPSLVECSNGTISGHKIDIRMKPGASPKVFKARPVPFALQPAVEQELGRLLKEGIIERVDPAMSPIEWASPLVIAPKPNGKIRLCADFRVTINKHILIDMHPLPTFEELCAQLAGGEQFSTIDLRDAYLQMEVEEESKKYLVISTHKGFFRYRRMPFGISSAPAKFQKTMETVLQGIPGVKCFLDDIMVTARNREDHLKVVKLVLERLNNAGMRIRPEKCKWLRDSVIYLGHRVDKFGIHPTEERIEAMKRLKDPTNVKELRSFLGCINYYQKFIPNLQGDCASLHRLLQKGVRWCWTSEHSKMVERLKHTLTSTDTLVHYDPKLPLVLYTDASETGVGAVLCHRVSEGVDRPIAYSSRSLHSSEKKYSVIDREALAIISAVRKFERYLYGRKFILRTDHKPLMFIFGERTELPVLAMSRVSRWALMLREFDFDIEYIPGTQNSPADVLSRLPVGVADVREGDFGIKIAHTRLRDICISKRLMTTRTSADPLLGKVIRFVQEAWPQKDSLEEGLRTYFEKKDELSFEEGMLMWKGRIVIPMSLREEVMEILHEGHPGSSAMRSIARMHVWWPAMDKEVETFLKKCSACQENRPWDPESPVYSWNVPEEPWSRLHVDFAVAFEGHNWLLVVDATTKWVEIVPMKITTAEKTIQAMEEMFSRFGMPRMVVSDNGPQFTSQQFQEYCKRNNVKHVTSTPYHPRTNGLAERAVRTFKQRFAASRASGLDLKTRLGQYLRSYRTSVHGTTGRTPAFLMFGRQLRTRLSLLKPSLADHIGQRLDQQQHARGRYKEFAVGEVVWVKRRKEDRSFQKAVVKHKTGPLSYVVLLNGQELRVHADHMRKGGEHVAESTTV